MPPKISATGVKVCDPYILVLLRKAWAIALDENVFCAAFENRSF